MVTEAALPPVDPDRFLAALRQITGRADISFAEAPAYLGQGGEAIVHTFRLRNAPTEFDRPLVLRRLVHVKRPSLLNWEVALHEALLDQAFPVPKILYVEPFAQSLGAPFLIAERIEGQRLLEAVLTPSGLLDRPGAVPLLIWDAAFRVPMLLADTMLALHMIRSDRVRKHLIERGLDPDAISYRQRLDTLAAQVEAAQLTGMKPGIEWLQKHEPPIDIEVVCHGDLLFTNLLAKGRTVTGVFDWTHATLGDPAYDVAGTCARLLSQAPDMPPLLNTLGRAVQNHMRKSFLQRYCRSMPLDPLRRRYYEAYWLLNDLVWGQQGLLKGASFDGRLESRWLHPATIAAGITTFAALTGVTLQSVS